ncbi:hypothetical protein AMSG_12464, partial [Thecamonas trahens ATCC 50062]
HANKVIYRGSTQVTTAYSTSQRPALAPQLREKRQGPSLPPALPTACTALLCASAPLATCIQFPVTACLSMVSGLEAFSRNPRQGSCAAWPLDQPQDQFCRTTVPLVLSCSTCPITLHR